MLVLVTVGCSDHGMDKDWEKRAAQQYATGNKTLLHSAKSADSMRGTIFFCDEGRVVTEVWSDTLLGNDLLIQRIVLPSTVVCGQIPVLK